MNIKRIFLTVGIVGIIGTLQFVLAQPVGMSSVSAMEIGGDSLPSSTALELAATEKLDPTFCDSGFVGEQISFTSAATLRMDDLLDQIHRRFGVNFVLGPGVGDLPVNIKTGSVPWSELLSSQLFLSGVRARCSGSTIQLVKNSDLPKLQDTAEVKTRFVKLKFLQPANAVNVDVAGRSGGGGGSQGCGGGGGGGSQGCSNFEKLIIEIEKILGLRAMQSVVGGGGSGSGGEGKGQQTEAQRSNRSISQIPGRNILVVRGTDEELKLIDEVIEKADRPPFQVIVKALVYTTNENKLREVGVESSIFGSTALTRPVTETSTTAGSSASSGATSGTTTSNGTTTTTATTTNSSGSSSGSATSTTVSSAGVPVRSGGIGFQTPTPGNLFNILALVGTVDFNIQANALVSKGALSVKSRPFAMVLDGQEAALDIGRSIPVIIQAQNALGGVPGQLEFVQASNILQLTPFVIDNEKGEPVGVNLGLRLEANDVDTSVVSQGVPSVNRQSIQTSLVLNQEKTVILGGFTVDSESDSKSKVPGIGDIPGLGWLFKKKSKSSQMNRLYFAISVSVVPFGSVIEPVSVPDATTDIPAPATKIK